MTLRGRDFVSMDDLSPEEVRFVLDTAVDLKRRAKAGDRPALLTGRVLAMIFEKPSLRTRVTFEVGMWELGGHAVYLAPQEAWNAGSGGSWRGPSRTGPCRRWLNTPGFL